MPVSDFKIHDCLEVLFVLFLLLTDFLKILLSICEIVISRSTPWQYFRLGEWRYRAD